MESNNSTPTQTPTAPQVLKHSNESRLGVMELANMISVPMSLHAIVSLKIPDTIYQSGLNTPLSPSQIISLLQKNNNSSTNTSNSNINTDNNNNNKNNNSSISPRNLQRLLRLLSSYNVFLEHSSPDNPNQHLYSLTPLGMTLVTNPNGVSYGDYVLQHHQDCLMRAWPLVHQAVLDEGVEPFVRANGVSAYSYYVEKPEMNELMQRAMTGVSVPFMEALLDGYSDAFVGVNTLVDVGGSSGACLKMIIDRCPHVTHGLNFDLPQVVAKAPSFPGITHVGGDMFKSIPSGDAIFMKWILTTWTDEECKVIMKNCFDALPKEGKLIACEPVLPEETDTSHRTRALLEGDIFVMTIYRAKGRHRTEEEFRQLANSVGFTNFRPIYVDYFYTVLEFQK